MTATTNTEAYQLKDAGLVSEQALESLLIELSNYAAKSCLPKEETPPTEEQLTIAAEMAAAKLERIGWTVGYRWTERLAQHKTWNAVTAGDEAAAVAAQQLEAVKFLCKEVWMEVFRKQIDKLQTNHRGVFVLKDLDLKWMTRCGHSVFGVSLWIDSGALANLGIPAVVSCDFLADGQNMSACSFNIKVK